MTTLALTSLGVEALGEREMAECAGGFSWVQVIGNWVFTQITQHAPEIYESAQATKRTFEVHPEIFVK